MRLLPNRIVVILQSLLGLVLIVLPLVESYDWKGQGIIGGVILISAAVYKWLDGWQKYEERVNAR